MNRSSARRIALGAALSLTATAALAQNYPGSATSSGGVRTDVAPIARPNATWTETTLSVTANTWTLAAAANQSRQKLVLGDATGLGCVWSTVSAPVTGEGFPFSFVGTGNDYVLDDPVPSNPIYVKCSSSGVVTIGAA